MTDVGHIRAAERAALEETLRKELEPLAVELGETMAPYKAGPQPPPALFKERIIDAFLRASIVIRRVQGRVTPTTWRHQHYAAGPRALCGIARPAVFLTRQKKCVTCSRCCKRLGIPAWTVKARRGAEKERHA